MVERLREDEDDGGQGDGDVACCRDEELFLQAASVGGRKRQVFWMLTARVYWATGNRGPIVHITSRRSATVSREYDRLLAYSR